MRQKEPDYVDFREGTIFRIEGETIKQRLVEKEQFLETEIAKTLTAIEERVEDVKELLGALVDGMVNPEEDLGNDSLFIRHALAKTKKLWRKRNRLAKIQDALEPEVIYLLSVKELEEYGF